MATAGPIVIVGAGKIGRGFLAHLIWRGGYPWTFIEANRSVVEGLRARGVYHVAIAGKSGATTAIRGFTIYHPEEPEARMAMKTAETIFTAVGGAQVESLGVRWRAVVAERMAEPGHSPVNWITCENWVHPAEVLRQGLIAGMDGPMLERAKVELGVAEATVLRSCIEPTAEQRAQDRFSVQVQDYWELQVDRDALVLPLPSIPGLVAVPNFRRALERKLYTYNAASATMSFLGALIGLRYLHEAASEPRILAITRQVLAETGQAVCEQYGYSRDDQERFAASAIAKYQDAAILDTLERNVRDPIRKLGRDDRLVGAARLCLTAGIQPRAVALAIAAGLRYREPSDPSAQRLGELMAQAGLDTVLVQVLGIDPDGALAGLIKTRMGDVDRFVRGEWPDVSAS